MIISDRRESFMWIQHTQKKTAMVNIDTKNSKRKNCLKKLLFSWFVHRPIETYYGNAPCGSY